MNGSASASQITIGPEASARLADALRALPSCQIGRLSTVQREDLALGDLFARVREEIALSRQTRPALLMPGYTAIEAAHELTVALRYARPGDDRGEIVQRAAALMALAARLAIEGTPVFPDSLPKHQPQPQPRTARFYEDGMPA